MFVTQRQRREYLSDGDFAGGSPAHPHVERPMADPPHPAGQAPVAYGPANVIMELAMLRRLRRVGAVSKVADRPIKRARTTLPTLRWPLPAATTRRRPSSRGE